MRVVLYQLYSIHLMSSRFGMSPGTAVGFFWAIGGKDRLFSYFGVVIYPYFSRRGKEGDV